MAQPFTPKSPLASFRPDVHSRVKQEMEKGYNLEAAKLKLRRTLKLLLKDGLSLYGNNYLGKKLPMTHVNAEGAEEQVVLSRTWINGNIISPIVKHLSEIEKDISYLATVKVSKRQGVKPPYYPCDQIRQCIVNFTYASEYSPLLYYLVYDNKHPEKQALNNYFRNLNIDTQAVVERMYANLGISDDQSPQGLQIVSEAIFNACRGSNEYIESVLGLDEQTIQGALNAVNPQFEFGQYKLQDLLNAYNDARPISANLIFKFPVYYRQVLTDIRVKTDRFAVRGPGADQDEFSKMLLRDPKPLINGEYSDISEYTASAQAALQRATNYLDYLVEFKLQSATKTKQTKTTKTDAERQSLQYQFNHGLISSEVYAKKLESLESRVARRSRQGGPFYTAEGGVSNHGFMALHTTIFKIKDPRYANAKEVYETTQGLDHYNKVLSARIGAMKDTLADLRDRYHKLGAPKQPRAIKPKSPRIKKEKVAPAPVSGYTMTSAAR